MTLVANARMYAVTPAVEVVWRRLFDRIGAMAGVALAYAEHPAPVPLENLWGRDDLGLVLMCGWPFANLYPAMQPIAAPVPDIGIPGGGPVYRTDLVVAAKFGSTVPETALRGRLAWTAEHSQSGFHAVREYLAARRSGETEPEAGPEWVGPFVTPRRVIDAVLAGEVDIGPLDAYWHALLKAHEPETAGRLVTLASTAPRPMPLLVAAPAIEAGIVGRLRTALLAASADPAARTDLAALRLAGFAAVGRSDYAPLAATGPVAPP